MNSLLFFTICGLLLFLIVFKQRKCWYFIWQLNGCRGLLQQPILWLLLIIYLEPKSIMSSIQRCHKYFQFPLAIIVFNRILLYVDDPYTMENILTAPECLNKTFLQNGFYANKGLLHAKDEQWKIRRKQLNPAFSHNTLVSFFDVFNRVANDLKLKISEDLQGYTVKFKSLEDLIIRAVLEASCLTTMGYATNFLKQDEKCIAQSYRYLMELTALRILRPWYQIDFIFRLLDNKNYEKSKRANKLVKEFVANIVQEKHTEWQYKHRLSQKPDIKSTSSDCAIATNRAKDERMLLNEHREHNNDFTGNTTAADANDALKIITQQILTLQDKNKDSNSFMPKQQQQQQQSRIFIDQIFYLAQMGKLTLHDIMNESQSMVVVSFETVSSCIINALLCLAINHECQTKLRHEIKNVLLLSKNKRKSKNKTKSTSTTTTTTTTTKSSKKPNPKGSSANTINNDLDFDATANVHVNYSSRIEYNDDDDVDDDADDNNNDNDVADVEVTIEDLLNMSYLDMIINESLRLLTTVPMNLRNVSSDFQLNVMQCDKCTSICNMKNRNNKNNYSCSSSRSSSCCCCQRSIVVPKDTIVALDIFNMQRNEMYWGKNALKFYPEHFSKTSPAQHQQKEGKYEEEQQIHETSISSTKAASTSRHSYTFIPFSKGLRTCIGYRYSIYLSKIVLIKLISSFEVSTNIQLQDLQCYEGVSLKFRNAEEIQFQIQPLG